MLVQNKGYESKWFLKSKMMQWKKLIPQTSAGLQYMHLWVWISICVLWSVTIIISLFVIFAGVFNVVTGNGAFGQSLAEHPKVDKVGFTGSTEVGQILRKATAGSGKKLSLELGGKSPFVVFDSADLDTAVEGVVDAIYFNQGQVSRLYSNSTSLKYSN